jgi:hypothetical protein
MHYGPELFFYFEDHHFGAWELRLSESLVTPLILFVVAFFFLLDLLTAHQKIYFNVYKR